MMKKIVTTAGAVVLTAAIALGSTVLVMADETDTRMPRMFRSVTEGSGSISGRLDKIKELLEEKGISTEGLTEEEIMQKVKENEIGFSEGGLRVPRFEHKLFNPSERAAELGIDVTGKTDEQIMEAIQAAQLEKLKAALIEKGVSVDGLSDKEIMVKALENGIMPEGFVRFKLELKDGELAELPSLNLPRGKMFREGTNALPEEEASVQELQTNNMINKTIAL